VSRNWVAWHADYERDTPLRRRLTIVQGHIADVLRSSGRSPLTVVSICSGDGRDLLGPLARDPARNRVRGRLVELNAELAAKAVEAANDASLPGIDVVVGDAGVTTAYRGVVPADLVLICGVFGNIVDADIERTISALPMLCADGATIIWTRHRRPPDLTPTIRRWFREAGFVEVAFEAVPGSVASVGVERLARPPTLFEEGVRLFSFFEPDAGMPT
jgi:hypothetical protein